LVPEVRKLRVTLADVVEKEDPTERFTQSIRNGGATLLAFDRETHERVLVRQIPIEEKKKANLAFELYQAKIFQHHNVIKYLGSYIVDNCLWLVTEYIERDQALSPILVYSIDQKSKISEKVIGWVCLQVLEALRYLHSKHVLYDVLKSDDILVTTDGHLKLACISGSTSRPGTASVIGTPYWKAPESILGKPCDGKVDIWALGILVREMYDGEPPLMMESMLKTLFIIATTGVSGLSIESGCSSNMAAFTTQCLQCDANNRPSADELLGHPFIQSAQLSRAEGRRELQSLAGKTKAWGDNYFFGGEFLAATYKNENDVGKLILQ